MGFFGSSKSMDEFEISVKFIQFQNFNAIEGNSPTMTVNIHAGQRGDELRSKVARLSGKSPAEIGLIFAGKLISDLRTMQDLRIFENTLIHAVPLKRIQPTPISDSMDDIDDEENFKSTHDLLESRIIEQGQRNPEDSCLRPSFYVYCRSRCRSVQPGKLRVCCSACKNPAFFVKQDPTCLDDVLFTNRISGSCLLPGCPGTKARNPEDSCLRPSFYVYCRSRCRSVQPGKLRVCCSACKNPAFFVKQDPTCLDDVLFTNRISGSCLLPGCPGTKAEFFFKCASHVSSEEDQVTLLPLIRTNTRRVICITCADVLTQVLVFPCSASHVMCLECFSQYCRLYLDERRFIQNPELGYTLPCPAGCEDSLIRETHHFLILGKEQYARYKRFGTEEYLLGVGGVLCPAPGCGAGILPETDDRRVECHQEEGFGCGFVFCRNCHEAYHEGECGQRRADPDETGLRSNVNAERERRARWQQEESQRTIAETSKPCPNCKVPVERNGGCMHMVCSRTQCKYEWCWICGIKWNMECLEDHWFGTEFGL